MVPFLAPLPPQSPQRQGAHPVFALVDERSALVDSPSFREQLRNANDWSLDARARVERVAKLPGAAALADSLKTLVEWLLAVV